MHVDAIPHKSIAAAQDHMDEDEALSLVLYADRDRGALTHDLDRLAHRLRDVTGAEAILILSRGAGRISAQELANEE